MVKYLKLVLEGFGCFEQKAEFNLSGGLDTLVGPNETGKSTMLNGLVHTIFGLEKPGKERFRSWAAAQRFKGELTLLANGVEYVISMDFDKDRVAVKKKDEHTGNFTSEVKEQSHVPAGTKSKAYGQFLQEILGTVSIEVFKSAFIVEQPIKDEPELGEGGKLVVQDAGGIFEKATEKLLARLGKDENTGITMHLEQWGYSIQRKARQLEKLEEAYVTKEVELKYSERLLNQLAPLVEKQKVAEAALSAAKAGVRANRDRHAKVKRWLELREAYKAQNDASNAKKSSLEGIDEKLAEKRQAESEHAKLSGLQMAAPVEKPILYAAQEDVKTAEKHLSDAAAIVKRNAELRDEASVMLPTDLLTTDADEKLGRLIKESDEKAAAIREAKAARTEWERQYSSISGAFAKDRADWEKELRTIGAGSSAKMTKGVGAAGPILLIIGVICLLADTLWVSLAGLQILQIVFGTLAIGSFIIGLIIAAGGRRTKGDVNPPDAPADEKVRSLNSKIALYDMQAAKAAPNVPPDADTSLQALKALSADAAELKGLSAAARQAIGRIGKEALDSICGLAGLSMLTAASLIGRDVRFWDALRETNAAREAHATALAAHVGCISNADKVIKGLIQASKADTLEQLREMADAAQQSARAAYDAWSREFGSDITLKPDIDYEVLKYVESERDALAQDEAILDDRETLASSDLEDIKDQLREARSGDVGNIPSLVEEMEELAEQIDGLQEESQVVALALSQMKAAGEEFGEESYLSLRKSITGMLERVTGVSSRNVVVDKKFALEVEFDGRGLTYDQLSQGTKDQLYICMRLAAAELLGEERKLPVFFDDSFGTTDRKRLDEIKRLLDGIVSDGRQIVILSHSDEISCWGSSIGANYS